MDMTPNEPASECQHVLQLPQPLSIRSVEAAHDLIKSALLDHSEVALDIERDADPDLSILQLIEAARLYAASEGKNFRLQRPASPSVRLTLERAGLVENSDANFHQFWFHDEV